MAYKFNPFTGKLDEVVSGTGSTSQPLMIASARIRRDADTLFNSPWQTHHRNCSLNSQLGAAFTLDNTTGRFTIPPGAVYVRIHSKIQMGSAVNASTRIETDITPVTNGTQIFGHSTTAGAVMTAHDTNVVGASWVELNVNYSDTFVANGVDEFQRDIGVIEFYG